MARITSDCANGPNHLAPLRSLPIAVPGMTWSQTEFIEEKIKVRALGPGGVTISSSPALSHPARTSTALGAGVGYRVFNGMARSHHSLSDPAHSLSPAHTARVPARAVRLPPSPFDWLRADDTR